MWRGGVVLMASAYDVAGAGDGMAWMTAWGALKRK